MLWHVKNQKHDMDSSPECMYMYFYKNNSIHKWGFEGIIDVCQTTPSVALENSVLLLLEN